MKTQETYLIEFYIFGRRSEAYFLFEPGVDDLIEALNTSKINWENRLDSAETEKEKNNCRCYISKARDVLDVLVGFRDRLLQSLFEDITVAGRVLLSIRAKRIDAYVK